MCVYVCACMSVCLYIFLSTYTDCRTSSYVHLHIHNNKYQICIYHRLTHTHIYTAVQLQQDRKRDASDAYKAMVEAAAKLEQERLAAEQAAAATAAAEEKPAEWSVWICTDECMHMSADTPDEEKPAE